MSTANYIERAITGLKPDVALVASIFANQIHDFTPRLLKALNYPRVLLPTHWDNFEAPYSEPPCAISSATRPTWICGSKRCASSRPRAKS
jgi:hypothetical protein